MMSRRETPPETWVRDLAGRRKTAKLFFIPHTEIVVSFGKRPKRYERENKGGMKVPPEFNWRRL